MTEPLGQNGDLRTLWLIALVVIVVPLILGWMIRQVNSRLGTTLTLFGHLVARVAVVVAFVSVTVYAVEKGTLPWALLAALFGILALGSMIVGGIYALAVVHTVRGSDSSEA
jgi:predicted neutral ceramidase superfamily lipid hydrolase